MRTLIWLLCLIPMALPCHASAPRIRSVMFPFASELPSNEITDIFQDSTGFIWLGTSNGLGRYDGHNVQTVLSDYRCPERLTDNRITCFAEDERQVWIGTFKGLNVYDKKTMVFRPYPHKALQYVCVCSMCHTGDGYLWIAGHDALYRLHTATGHCTLYRLNYSDKSTVAYNQLYRDRNNTLWICSQNGLLRHDKAGNRFVRYPSIGIHNNPYCLFQDKEGRYWISTWGDGLWQMETSGSTFTATYRRQVLENPRTRTPDERFFSMTQDDVYGYLWVLSYNSLYALRMSPRSGLLEPVDINDKVDVNKMYTRVIKDHDGNLWLSSYDHGTVISFPTESIENHPLDNLRKDLNWTPNLLTLCRDSEGCFWFNQDRFGICVQHPEDNTLTYGSAELRRLTMDARVMTAHLAGNGIWSTHVSAPAIYHLQREGGRIRCTHTIDLHAQLAHYKAIAQMSEDSQGRLWILSEGRIVMYRTQDSSLLATCPVTNGFLQFAIDRKDRIWAVFSDNDTYDIYAVTPDNPYDLKCVRCDKLPIPQAEKVQSMCADDKECLWFSTSRGRIWMYDTRQKTFSDRTTELNKNGIHILNLLSHDRYLWVITHRCITQYDLESGTRIEHKVPNDYAAVRIFRDRSACTDRDGTLYAGGNNGFIAIRPSKSQDNRTYDELPIVLSDIRVDGESLFFDEGRRNGNASRNAGKPVLPHGARNIDIDFTTLHSLGRNDFRYEFRMEGVDEQWIVPEPGTHTAFYNKLGKGSHPFYVRYHTPSGSLSREILLADIYVEPAWWETTWAYLIYMLAGAACVMAFSHVYLIWLRSKNERRLQDTITQTKLDYFTNISHELLTPLTVISCVADYWENHYPAEKQQTGIMRNHIYRLKHLLQQILDFRKSESGGLRLKVREGDITAFIRQACPTNFLPSAVQKQLHVKLSIPEKEAKGYLDFDKVDKILYNLISNAIKYTPNGKSIGFTARLRTKYKKRYIMFRVEDEGVGIPLEEQPCIFTRFYTGSNGKNGTSNGIGLALVKELTEMHHGTIRLESTPGKGSAFTVVLPVDRRAYTEEEIDTATYVSPPENETGKCGAKVTADTEERPVVMFVDDNTDLSTTLKRLFAPYYEVISANGGEEALRLLEQTSPDIIVSDVMMPEPNGFALCRHIKSQLATSHIPVILLTVKHSADDRVEAYNVGADGYLAKPFETKVLKARIDNLLRSNKERQQNFCKRDRIYPNGTDFPTLDTTLLQRITDYIHAHLDDEECSLELLANYANLSVSTLNYKMKALTGLTPAAFVKNIKLKYACTMLARRDMTVSEVSYAVGYSTPKYFTLCFKKEFGITPTEYQQQQKNTGKKG